jgi:predicted transcriptional regulator
MAKIFERKRDKTKYQLIQIRISEEERCKLRVLAAELGITVQMFIKRLIQGSVPRTNKETPFE